MTTSRIVECVPNFSEGRDRAVIDAIADAIRGTAGCTLLDVDPGASTNRTVYTFVGDPEAVVEGALAAAREAQRAHRHAPPQGRAPADGRPGRLPVRARLRRDHGGLRGLREGVRAARGGRSSGIPVYLYEAASTQAHRKTLKQIRAGEYEGLGAKIAQPDWKPGLRARGARPRLGRHGHRRPRLPHRLQRQRPRHQGAGPPHRAERARAGPRPEGAGAAQGGEGHRLVGGRVRHGPGLDEPRRLHRDSPARGLRGLRGGGARAQGRGGGLGARGAHPAAGPADGGRALHREGEPVHRRRAAEDPPGRGAAGPVVDYALRPRQAHHRVHDRRQGRGAAGGR